MIEGKGKTITELLAALGGAIASFFMELPAIIWVLIAVMSIDYVTGIICGLMDKAVSMRTGAEFAAVAGATCLWFIASEGFSILENAAAMGIPIPKILLHTLEMVKQKGEGPEQAEEKGKKDSQE